MAYKKLFIVILSSVFVLTVLAVGFFALNVNKIDVEFSFYGENEEKQSRVISDLSVLNGRNLLFFDDGEVKSIIEKDAYLECVSIEKKFPNSVTVKVSERKEVYVFSYGDKRFLASEKGVVLSEYDGEVRRDMIALSFKDIAVLDASIGAQIKTDADESVYTALKIAETVNLTDCIKVITVENKIVQTDVVFDTYTNVKIRVVDALNGGEIKAAKAFNVYDEEKKDYIKSFNELKVFLMDGSPVAVWTRLTEES